jgi:hypothetical protein
VDYTSVERVVETTALIPQVTVFASIHLFVRGNVTHHKRCVIKRHEADLKVDGDEGITRYCVRQTVKAE